MKKTIVQIVEQHYKIVKHFLVLQRDMEDISEMIALLGYDIEELTESLQGKNKNNTLQDTDHVN